MDPDYMWQYWILELLIPRLKKEYRLQLKQDIENLAAQPNINEDTNAVIEQAQECIEKCFAQK